MYALIGGTGFDGFDDRVSLKDELWQTTPYGEPSAPIESLDYKGVNFFFLARHGNPHEIPPHKINYRANLYALKALGAKAILGVNAVGAISSDLITPQMVVPDQIIDLTYGREHTYSDGAGLVALNHIDFSNPYSEVLRSGLIESAKALKFKVATKSTYTCTQGPRLETAAEINYIESIGGDLVGMTAMPEAALSRELGLDYANLCLVVNPAAGRGPKTITLDDIKAAYRQGMVEVRETLLHFLIS